MTSRWPLILCDEPHHQRSQDLDAKALKAATQQASSKSCAQLVELFEIDDETVVIHLQLIGKGYKLRKLVGTPHTVSSQQGPTSDSLFTIAFFAPQHTHIRSSAHY